MDLRVRPALNWTDSEVHPTEQITALSDFHQMPSIYDTIVELIDRGTPIAVALVVSARGSTPQCSGARAITDASGRLWGTIGGGMVESQAIRLAREACRTGKAHIFDCEMTN